jgi:phage terminase small subunit
MLTDKQERFAQCIALEGMNQSEAYRECYNTENMQESTIWESASRLANDCKVLTRINELRGEVVSPKIMNAKERREKLTEWANSDDPNVSMKAMDLLNKMDGEYTTNTKVTLSYEDKLKEVIDEDEY